MPVTMILSPLEEDDDNFASAGIVYLDICAYLNSETFKDCELDFEEFLSKLNLDFETYIYAFRSSLKQDKVFLKSKTKRGNNKCIQCHFAEELVCKHGHPVYFGSLYLCNIHCFIDIKRTKGYVKFTSSGL